MELDVDHIVPRSRGGTDNIENLQTLCRNCHRRKTLVDRGILPTAAFPMVVRLRPTAEGP
jgi:5-methylcytosine-specific restriction endonuclease McrA